MAIDSVGIGEQNKTKVSRRGFLATASATGAFVLMARVTTGGEIEVEHGLSPQEEDFSPDLFISIAPNGDVTIMAHRSEMGTGIRTALPRIIADELDADWERVTIKQAIGDQRYGSQNTDGSNSVRGFFGRMRAVGAKARMMLEQAAADQWKVSVEDVEADLHKIVNKKSGDSLGYGKLVEAAKKLDVPARGDLKYKPREKWRYIGKKSDIVDIDDIITGKAVYGVDAKMDGMVYALVKRPPVVGGEVKSFDAEATKKMPGVVDVIEIPKYRGPAPAFSQLGGVAVLAESTWQAWQGRDELKVEWEHGPNAIHNTKTYKDDLKASVGKKGQAVRKAGDAMQALTESENKISADYSVPYLSHAPMEVPAAVADVKTDDQGKAVSCHMYASTQNPQAAQAAVAQALGIRDASKVVVEVTLLGSGFGRKSKPDYCVEAAILSQKAKRPVHVMFTREDDIRHDFYHTMSEMHFEAAVGEDGKPTAWLARAAYPPIGSTFNPRADTPGGVGQGFQDIPYDIPNIQVEACKAKGHVRIGWLRAVNHIHQNFAVSCFADELAHHAGENPKDYLMKILGEDRILKGVRSRPPFPWDVGRLKRTLARAAELCDWDNRYGNMPKGSGLGIACARSFSSYAAHVFEVNVSKDGVLTVPKAWVVLDAGTVVSPDRVKAQMEGTIAMTMGQAMFGRITFADGRCEQSNYDSYKMCKMEHYPKEVVCDIVESTEAPAGVGESTVASAAPALCNAIFAATGKRVRDLPLEDHDLSWS